jgi:hypothetical protein
MSKKVKVGKSYRFNPVPFDMFNPPIGVKDGNLRSGDVVRVVNKFGCPKANTMGMCYIEKGKTFMGMVMTNSLEDL